MRCPALVDLPEPSPAKSGWPWREETPRLPETTPIGKPWPRISVVTPSYNQGQFIEETIRSVLLQGYPDLEYIILDGGSTDTSVDQIRRYEPWLSYWVSEPDGGQTQAVNRGWARATGQILAYINSDDCYLPGALAAAARAFDASPNAGMVYGTATIVDEAGREVRNWEAQPFDLRTMLTVDNTVPQPATFFAREALERVGFLDERWHMIMDYELSIRLGLRFPSVCVPGTFAKFRDHLSSKTRTQFARTANELIRFATSLFASERDRPGLLAAKRATFGRYYYMLALGYIGQGRPQAARGLGPLLRSVFTYPPYAAGRPVQTAYVLKEIALGQAAALVGARPGQGRGSGSR